MGLIIKKASAGSGKTFNLTLRFLMLALGSDSSGDHSGRYRRILAVTFTNEAAKEMKSRIIRALYEFAYPEKHDEIEDALLNLTIEETGLAEEEIKERSRAVLSTLLRHYADLSVSTIDSFAHRIIRSFSFDLNISSNFSVELNTDELAESAVDELLARAGTDKTATEILEQFVLRRFDDEKQWRPENELMSIAPALMQDSIYEHIKSLSQVTISQLNEVREICRNKVEQLRKNLEETGTRGLKLLADHDLSPSDFSRGSCFKYFERMQNADPGYLDQKTFLSGVEGKPWYKASCSPGAKAAIERITPDINDLLLKSVSLFADLIRYEGLHDGLYHTTTLKLLESHLTDIKERRHILHISDFNKYISEQVLSEPAPFIYERIGDFYKHYMIDEFQDTSKMQWSNLIPLTGNALSESGSVFIVGDAKQSIYRWRGGEVGQFIDLPQLPRSNENIAQWQTTFSNSLREDDTGPGYNFRSSSGIVKFNNMFFKEAAQKVLSPRLQKVYEDCEQKPREDKTGGYVRFELMNESRMNAEEGYEIIYGKIADLIIELTREKKLYKGEDIFILCRRNAQIAAISSFLKDRGIDVFTEASITLGQTPETVLVSALFKLCIHPDDTYYRTRALLMSDKSHYRSEPGAEALTPEMLNARYSEFLALFGLTMSDFSRKSLYEIFESVTRKLFGNMSVSPALLAMGDEIHQFVSKEGDDLKGFCDLWDKELQKISPPVNVHEDFVRVMTIHKSKGLEAEVIIMPELTDPFKNSPEGQTWVKHPFEISSGPIDISSLFKFNSRMKYNADLSEIYEEEADLNQLDNLNNMYVGFTRAVERLYGYSYKQKKKGTDLPHILKDLTAVSCTNDEIFEFGDPDTGAGRPLHSSGDREIPPAFHSFDYLNKLRIVPRDDIRVRGREKTAAEMGSITHEVLERVTDADRIDSLLLRVEKKYALNADETNQIKKWITDLFKRDELKRAVLSKDAFNERELYDRSGNRILRPDKVVKTAAGRYILIDFKTGLRQPEAIEQMRSYEKTLRETGIDIEKKLLVYLDRDEVVEV